MSNFLVTQGGTTTVVGGNARSLEDLQDAVADMLTGNDEFSYDDVNARIDFTSAAGGTDNENVLIGTADPQASDAVSGVPNLFIEVNGSGTITSLWQHGGGDSDTWVETVLGGGGTTRSLEELQDAVAQMLVNNDEFAYDDANGVLTFTGAEGGGTHYDNIIIGNNDPQASQAQTGVHRLYVQIDGNGVVTSFWTNSGTSTNWDETDLSTLGGGGTTRSLEDLQDAVAAMFTDNSEFVYDDASGTINYTDASTDTNTQRSDEEIQDVVGAMFSGNTEFTYNDTSGIITFANGVTARTDEDIQDVIGALLGANTEFTYNDAANTLTFSGGGGNGNGGGASKSRHVFWWEENGPVASGTEGGRQWSLGNGGVGGGLYVPFAMDVVALSLEMRVTDPDGTSNLSITETTVIIENVPDGDSNAARSDTDDPITGLTVTVPDTTTGEGVRNKAVVFVPSSTITIPAGSNIRPRTTAPSAAAGSEMGVVTLWTEAASGGGVNDNIIIGTADPSAAQAVSDVANFYVQVDSAGEITSLWQHEGGASDSWVETEWPTGGGGTARTDAEIQDVAGTLLATLSEFSYDTSNNSLTFSGGGEQRVIAPNDDGTFPTAADNIGKILVTNQGLYIVESISDPATDPVITWASYTHANYLGEYIDAGLPAADGYSAQPDIYLYNISHNIFQSVTGTHFLYSWTYRNPPSGWLNAYYSTNEADAHVTAIGQIAYFPRNGTWDLYQVQAGSTLGTAGSTHYDWVQATAQGLIQYLTTEQVQDVVAAMFAGNSEITYNDTAGTLSISITDTNTQRTDEDIQDLVSAMFVGNTEFSYDDDAGTITLTISDTNTQRTDDEIRDLAGNLIATLSEFSYNATTNTLTFSGGGDGTGDNIAIGIGDPQASDVISGVDNLYLETNASGVITSLWQYNGTSWVETTLGGGGVTPRTDEEIQDVVGAMLSHNSEFTYDDANARVDYVDESTDTNTQRTDAEIQDVAGALLAAIDEFSYDDANNTLSFSASSSDNIIIGESDPQASEATSDIDNFYIQINSAGKIISLWQHQGGASDTWTETDLAALGGHTDNERVFIGTADPVDGDQSAGIANLYIQVDGTSGRITSIWQHEGGNSDSWVETIWPSSTVTPRTDAEIQDVSGALLAALSEFTYDTSNNTLTFTNSVTARTDEEIQDVVGEMLSHNSGFTYDDDNNRIDYVDESTDTNTQRTDAEIQDVAGALLDAITEFSYDDTNNTLSFSGGGGSRPGGVFFRTADTSFASGSTVSGIAFGQIAPTTTEPAENDYIIYVTSDRVYRITSVDTTAQTFDAALEFEFGNIRTLEQLQDAVADMLITNSAFTYNEAAGTITFSGGGTGTVEEIQDIVGAMLSHNTEFTYNDDNARIDYVDQSTDTNTQRTDAEIEDVAGALLAELTEFSYDTSSNTLSFTGGGGGTGDNIVIGTDDPVAGDATSDVENLYLQIDSTGSVTSIWQHGGGASDSWVETSLAGAATRSDAQVQALSRLSGLGAEVTSRTEGGGVFRPVTAAENGNLFRFNAPGDVSFNISYVPHDGWHCLATNETDRSVNFYGPGSVALATPLERDDLWYFKYLNSTDGWLRWKLTADTFEETNVGAVVKGIIHYPPPGNLGTSPSYIPPNLSQSELNGIGATTVTNGFQLETGWKYDLTLLVSIVREGQPNDAMTIERTPQGGSARTPLPWESSRVLRWNTDGQLDTLMALVDLTASGAVAEEIRIEFDHEDDINFPIEGLHMKVERYR